MVTKFGSLVIYVPIWMPLTRENHPSPQGDLNTRVDASRDDVDAWLAAKSGAPGTVKREAFLEENWVGCSW